MKQVIIGAMAVAGLVALVSLIDLAAGYPFSRQVTMDIMFIVAAVLIGWMGWESLQEQR